MIIAIDGNEANTHEKVGVSTYTYQILKYFQKKACRDIRFIVFLRKPPLEDMPKCSDNFTYEVIPGRIAWSQIFLPLRLYQKKLMGQSINVFFSPAHYSPRFCPWPLVVTIHDLSYIYYPNDFLKKDLYTLKNWTLDSVKKAKKIITVSKTTKKDVIKNYQVEDNKVEVIYNGYEKLKNNPTLSLGSTSGVGIRLPRGEKLHRNYILYVGTLQSRKNIPILIKAFAHFKVDYPEFQLVIAGKKGWLFTEIFNEVERLNLKKDVVFTGYIEDEKIVELYKSAFCFILPSLYEGFGITLVEAMSFGCPTIASFTSSLPEVGGEASLYFDPQSEKDLYEKLKLLKEDKNLRQELIKKGRERVKLFSWDKCAEETLTILKSI